MKKPKLAAALRLVTGSIHAIRHMPAAKLECLAYTVTVHAMASAQGKSRDDLDQKVRNWPEWWHDEAQGA